MDNNEGSREMIIPVFITLMQPQLGYYIQRYIPQTNWRDFKEEQQIIKEMDLPEMI